MKTGDLSKNFNRKEFECHGEDCCDHSAPVDPRLLDAIQELRDIIDVPLSLTNGFRCRKHNRAIDGAEDSYHCLSMAADVFVDTKHKSRYCDPLKLALMAGVIDAFNLGGIGVYEWGIHVDVRTTGRARWRG